MYVIHVGKVAALQPIGVGQSTCVILVAVVWRSLVTWSVVAYAVGYTVGCHSITACMLPLSNCW